MANKDQNRSVTHTPQKDTKPSSHISLEEVQNRHYGAAKALDDVRSIMREGCRIGRYRDGAFAELDFHNIEIALEKIIASPAVSKEDATFFRDTKLKVTHLQAFRMGYDTIQGSITDLSWILALQRFFDNDDLNQSKTAKATVLPKQTIHPGKKQQLPRKDDGFDDVSLTDQDKLLEGYEFVEPFKGHLAGR